MEIKAKNYEIHLDQNEMWDLMFDIYWSILRSVENHWVNHQDIWEKEEAKKLKMLERFCNVQDRPDIFRSLHYEVEQRFKAHNEKKSNQ